MTNEHSATRRLRKLTDELDKYANGQAGDPEWRHEMSRLVLVEIHTEVHRLQRNLWREIVVEGRRWAA
jgi:hypothetical protein